MEPTAPPTADQAEELAIARDDEADDQQDPRVPATVLTGFLGSGKTTLLNHILTATHGKKIAIIENEFGDTSIDEVLRVLVSKKASTTQKKPATAKASN